MSVPSSDPRPQLVSNRCDYGSDERIPGNKDRSADLRLAERLASGCESAWREFVVGYAGLVRSRVARVAATCGLSPDVSVVDDLVAEVFSALLRNDSAALRAYAGRSSLGTYLCVIASRVAIRTSIKTSPQPNVAMSEDAVDPKSTGPEDAMIHQEQGTQLRELIASLPPKQRDIVRLFHLEGHTYEQISRELQIPIGSVGPTLKRAEAKLRDNIEP